MSSPAPEVEGPVSKKRKVTAKKSNAKAEAAKDKAPKSSLPTCEEEMNDEDKMMMSMKKAGSSFKDIAQALSELTGETKNVNTIASRYHRINVNLKVWPAEHDTILLAAKQEVESNLEKIKWQQINDAVKTKTEENYGVEAIQKRLRQLVNPATGIPNTPSTPKTATLKKTATPKKASTKKPAGPKKSASPKKPATAPTPAPTNPEGSEDGGDADDEEVDGVDDEEANGIKEEGDAEIKEEDAEDQADEDEDMAEDEDLLEPEGAGDDEI